MIYINIHIGTTLNETNDNFQGNINIMKHGTRYKFTNRGNTSIVLLLLLPHCSNRNEIQG